MDGAVSQNLESDEAIVLWESGHNRVILHDLSRAEIVGEASFEVCRELVFKHLRSFIAHARTGLVEGKSSAPWTAGLVVSWRILHLVILAAIAAAERPTPALRGGSESARPRRPRLHHIAAAELLTKLLMTLGRCNPEHCKTELTEAYLRKLERFDTALASGSATAVESMVWMIPPSTKSERPHERPAMVDQHSRWYRVTDAGEMLHARLQAVSTRDVALKYAISRVSRAASRSKNPLKSNGLKGQDRRIDPLDLHRFIESEVQRFCDSVL
jgi:hypothetical protein